MLKRSNHDVSVCIASFNGEKFIKQQIESILKQLEDDDEIIISDNGSTDRTLEIIKSFKDNRIKIFNFERNFPSNVSLYEAKLESIYFNFKNAFEKSSNNIVFLSDQDDIWADDKYKIVKKAMLDYDFVAHDCAYLSDEDIGQSMFDLNDVRQDNLNYYNLFKKNPFLGCCIAFKREIGCEAFKYSRAILPHDTWLSLVAYSKGKNKILVLDEVLLYYRIHGNNNSYDGKSNNSLYFKLKYRFILLFHLLKNMTYAR